MKYKILFFNYYDVIWKVYEELGILISTELYVTNFCSLSSGSKLVSTTVDLLKDIFITEDNVGLKEDLLQGKSLNNLFKLTNFVNIIVLTISF